MLSTTTRLIHCPEFQRRRLGFTWEGLLIPVIPSHFYERFNFYLWEMKEEFEKEKESNQALSIISQAAVQSNTYYIVFYFVNYYSETEKEIMNSLRIPKSFFYKIPLESKKRLWYSKYHLLKMNLDKQLQRYTIDNGYNGFEDFIQKLKVLQQYGIYLVDVQHHKTVTVDDVSNPMIDIESIDLGTPSEWIPFSFEEFPFTSSDLIEDFSFSLTDHCA